MKVINKKAIIKKIKHQGIGEKEINLEKEMKFKEAPSTIALKNYIDRKQYKKISENKRLYYGKVGNFGYFVDDEDLEEGKIC